MPSQRPMIHLRVLMISITCFCNTFQTLLKTFNGIWKTGYVPKSWKEATIIPIPKHGKDDTNPNNYRPIALTNCISKTLERMINERLVWYLETNNIITEFQSGFRHQADGWFRF